MQLLEAIRRENELGNRIAVLEGALKKPFDERPVTCWCEFAGSTIRVDIDVVVLRRMLEVELGLKQAEMAKLGKALTRATAAFATEAPTESAA